MIVRLESIDNAHRSAPAPKSARARMMVDICCIAVFAWTRPCPGMDREALPV